MIRTIKRGERETHVTPAEQKRNAKEFVKRWKAAEGNEEREARSFWIELVQECLGIPQATRVLDFERKVRGRRVDVFYEDMGILIENKSRGCSLDETYIRSKKAGEETPYQQGKWYADNMPNSVRPRWILVCNFDEIRIHDLEREDPETDFVSISLEELPDHLYLLRFFTDKGGSRIERERDLSVQAGELVGRLYSQLYGQYKHIDTDEREQRSLNILIVRLVFLLYVSGGTDNLLNYVVLFVSVICMSVFFSVHYLTLYYLLQPYNAGTEIKSGMYKIITWATYFVCYMMINVKMSTLVFGVMTIVFCVIYCIVANILVYLFAPKTFRIRV